MRTGLLRDLLRSTSAVTGEKARTQAASARQWTAAKQRAPVLSTREARCTVKIKRASLMLPLRTIGLASLPTTPSQTSFTGTTEIANGEVNSTTYVEGPAPA